MQKQYIIPDALLCEPDDVCSACDDAVCLSDFTSAALPLLAAAVVVDFDASLADFLDFDDTFDADLLGCSIDCDNGCDSVICEG